jgi:hypothetical protein
MFLQLPTGRADGFQVQRHRGLPGRAPAFTQVAGSARGDDILPCRAATLGTRHDVVERQVAPAPAILAFEPVPQEQVEPGKGRNGFTNCLSAITDGSLTAMVALRTSRS